MTRDSDSDLGTQPAHEFTDHPVVQFNENLTRHTKQVVDLTQTRKKKGREKKKDSFQLPRPLEMWDYGEENRCVELAAVSIAMAGVSVVAVAMRSYTMSTILKRFVIEDWLAVLTCVSLSLFRYMIT